MHKILFKFCTSSYLTVVLYARIYGKFTIFVIFRIYSNVNVETFLRHKGNTYIFKLLKLSYMMLVQICSSNVRFRLCYICYAGHLQVLQKVACIIFCRFFTTHGIISILEDENVAANIFIKPNDGGVTDEDSGEEDGGGFLSNLSRKQLNATAELFISTQKCSLEETSSHSPETFSCLTSQPNITNSIPKPDESEKLRKSSYQTLKWKKKIFSKEKYAFSRSRLLEIQRLFSCRTV